ncbi:GNAT family N-acetyltransferase [Granulicella sibirica]|uniref:Acetyltransferase, GNAT family n=1 Tax=Granulicella sibirica TaxID=2479048 RepID=A0A4Q0T652_9BACT|nr:GNAT family N-acetyltransferase [Granulicella sibirica]RXH57578.1 acetyltransferase, GNAT family [Granulicella sibirica]
MHPADILTRRLHLVAITPAALHSEQSNDDRLGLILQAAIPENWPPADWEPHVFTILLAQYEKHPQQIAWHRYLCLRNPDQTRTLIGAAGAFWRETSPAECEIGYSVLSPWEGKGFATEAAQALIANIRLDPKIENIIAHTFPHLTASIRIMEKCGLTPDGEGEEPGTIRYRLRLNS